MNINEKFQLLNFNESVWEKSTKDTGTSIFIKDGLAYIQQNNGWSGGYIRTKRRIPIEKLKNKFIAEFDIEISSNYHCSSAGVRPYIGFVGADSNRDTAYYSSLSKNLVLEFDNNFIALGTRSDSQNNNSFKSISYNTSQKTKLKISVIKNVFKLFINNGSTSFIECNIPDNIWSSLGDNIRFEFYLGNYSSGQYMRITNVVIKDVFDKFLLQDRGYIKTTDGALLSLISKTPYEIEYFNKYGMESLEIINELIISNMQSNKFNVSMLKKK